MKRRTRWTGPVAAGLVLAMLAGCSKDTPHPIQVRANHLSVVNQTRYQWSDVEVWMNNHYRVTLPRLEPGQRFDAPLDVFVAGNGHRFQPKHQVPFGVQVLAKSADGTKVKIEWGKGRQWY